MATNCLEYLLEVSQKINNSCADQQTLRKYCALKDKILAKWATKGSDLSKTYYTAEKENKNVQSALRSSLSLAESSGSKRQNTRQSISKSQSKSTKLLQKGRIQTFQSRKCTQKTAETVKGSQLIILTQIATILKNVEACPSILKTIRLTFDSPNDKIEGIVKSIQDSLKNIYHQHMKPVKTQVLLQQSCQNTAQTKWNELISDNQWLISKLESLINQNSTLRRMVGRKIY